MARVGYAAKRAIAAFSTAALMLSFLPGAAIANEDAQAAADEASAVGQASVDEGESLVDSVSKAVEAVLKHKVHAQADADGETAAPSGASVETADAGEGAASAEGASATASDTAAAPDEGAIAQEGAEPDAQAASSASQESVPASQGSAAKDEASTLDDAVNLVSAEAGAGMTLTTQEEANDSSTSTTDSDSTSGSGTTTDSSSTTSSDSASTSTTHAPTVSVDHAIAWANTAANAKEWFGDEQAVLANGTADVISVKLADGSATLTAAELASKTEQDSAYYLKGVLRAPEGSTVTMKLTPARGYQLTTNTINSGKITLTPLDDDEKVGQYTFAMPSEGLALDCGFKAVSDSVVCEDSTAVKSGTISDADSVVTSGTLLLEVEDNDDADTKKAFNEKAGSNSVVAYLDTTLSNVVNQGSTEDSWENVLDSTTSPITVTLTLADSVVSGASSFYIIRLADDQYQQANVTYNAQAKTISFKSNKFESYAIVKGAPSSSSSGGSASGSVQGSTTPQTGDTNNTVPYVVSALASAALAVFALRKLRRL